MNFKKIAALAAAGLLAVSLSACGKSIDVDETGAVEVPGARALHRFCDGPTLIYVSVWDSTDDEYEWFYPGGCVKDPSGKWVFNTNPPAWTPPTGDSTDDKS